MKKNVNYVLFIPLGIVLMISGIFITLTINFAIGLAVLAGGIVDLIIGVVKTRKPKS